MNLPNSDGALKGGMFANGTLAATGRSAVNALPLASLIEEGGQTFVYAIKGGVIARKPITIGAKNVERGLVEIRSGIETGTEVIAVKAEGLKHGSKAVVVSGAAPSSKPADASKPDPASTAKS